MNPLASLRSSWKTFIFVFGLYAAWIVAWLIELFLVKHFTWLTAQGPQFFYWTLMRLVIWVLPAIVFIKISKLEFSDIIGADKGRSTLIWGVGLGLMLGALTFIERAFNYQPLFTPHLSWGFMTAVIVAPFVEELVFRGAVLGSLQRQYRFSIANTITALLFVIAHMPGWYFQGLLIANLTNPLGGALAIFLIGWALGYVKYRSGSILGSTLAHMLNNLFSIS